MNQFVHLHNHTEYSMLDGAAKIQKLVTRAAEYEMPAIAMTDHGNVHGAYEFWNQATAAGIKPIIGIEAYVAPGSRLDKSRVKWGAGGEDDVSGGGAYTHMTMWATDNASMHNLFRMSSESYMSGYYFKPRMDRELLSKFGKGIIATTGCPSGEVQTRLRLGQFKEALQAAADYRDIFGAGNYYLEIMDHGLGLEKQVRADLLRVAKELDLPLVATNDLHYTDKADSVAHDALLCVQVGSNLYDTNRFKFSSDDYYLKTSKQMLELFADLPDAAQNTLEIANRCSINFEKRDLMPKFPVPSGQSEAGWFDQEVWRGMDRRFPGGYPDRHRDQAKYEIEVIIKMGFPGYFLVVSDFIAWARAQGIRVGPGRGSAAGSLVSYAMGITELDPIAHDLIFERFLNPDRMSLPDIDVDFDDRRRSEVIRYVTEKYGADRVAQIATFSTIKAKQALKDSTRVLALPYSSGEKLTKAVPPSIFGRDISLSEIVDKDSDRYSEGADFRAILEADEEAAQIFELARGLENLKRQSGVHAAGVIMSAEPLIDVIPLMKREDDGAVITQFDQPPCEDLGLLKMDFLGLRNLTVIEDAIENIRVNRGSSVVLEELDLNADSATYDLLGRGETLGVFQLDGDNMRSLLRLLRPTEFEHISAVIALYRPGPMGMNSHINYAQRKNGLQKSDGLHPELSEPLSEILDPTYGLIVYQEQVMAAAQRVAGYTLGQADLLRRAMGKKKPEELEKQFELFHRGMQERGFSAAAVKALWDTLLPFADYAFNKSHSAGYAVLSFWTAYLKANYPAEYMAALLTSVGDSKDKLGIYLNECRRMGLQVLPPDVNQSIGVFRAVGDDVRFGLEAVRNIGKHVVDAAIVERAERPFLSFMDFVRRMPQQVSSKRVIESLIKAGAFDSMGSARRALLAVHEEAIESAAVVKKQMASGQGDLFGELEDQEFETLELPDLPEWTKRDLLAHEREMLGLYVSDHPLAGMEAALLRSSDWQSAALRESEVKDGEIIRVAGLITQVQHRVARASGNPYGQITLEDFSGEVMILFMGKTYLEFRDHLQPDKVVSIRGRVSRRDEEIGLHAVGLEPMDAGREQGGTIHLTLDEPQTSTLHMTELKEILSRNPGPVEVQVRLRTTAGDKHFLLPQRVAVSADLFGELKSLFGTSAVS